MTDSPITIRLGHSPDPDDAFMWWPLFVLDGAPPRLDTGRFRFEPVMQDIEMLNRRSMSGELEITAISVAQYPQVKDTYAFTSCGSSMGDGYGPKLVAREPMMTLEDLKDPGVVIAVPGVRTSAFATTSLMLGAGAFKYEVVEFDRIIEAMVKGDYQAGLIIHEGQLTYADSGLHLVEDLGHWWTKKTNLPLPLGGNVIRRDLETLYGQGTLQDVTTLLAQSLEYALGHREESIAYAMDYARDMGTDRADQFVSMYVNKWTLDFGPMGRKAVSRFLNEVHAIGLGAHPGEVDFIEPQKSIAQGEKHV
ncbi:MAG: ABC transporter substrate-binding protein [Planctomycetota bacterium]|nr:ABC transporter substrate-binding protein [Planctomycetota bacterium]